MPRRSKMKVIGGREYYVVGSTIDYGKGFHVVRKSYTTPLGKVVVENGKVYHPDVRKQQEESK